MTLSKKIEEFIEDQKWVTSIMRFFAVVDEN
jgi:hypothetical protein